MRDGEAAIRLQDYRPLDYEIESIDLLLRLDPKSTRVVAKSFVRRVGGIEEPLRLLGERQNLERVWVNGAPPAEGAMSVDAHGLTLRHLPDECLLEIESTHAPIDNHALEGLYLSGGRYCTQCEAEGFRKITYALDRPDSLSRYRVTIDAPKADFPVLLSNGNLIAQDDLPEGRHFAVWEDPFPKPSYLFAVAAGDYEIVRDTFVTQSGRSVALAVHVDHGDGERAIYALDSLKRAMRWDEQMFGREYDLDMFNIVAVRDFNFGAMENKGLNIFNSAYVLADSATATDMDFEAIESIVAHEYFHNWTGNRITCRDWFQLSLKEGLTVYRDQEFSADARSRAVQRIKDVKRLRARQYAEDAGPLAHPVRPSSYVKIDNFYTATVYEKGAEIVRMLHTMLGASAFRAGIDFYFANFDGKAVTLEDFVGSFERATGRDLSGFMQWYAQAGTPHVTARSTYDEREHRLAVLLRQSTPATPNQATKTPVPIPLRLGLIGPDGEALRSRYNGAEALEHLIVLDTAEAAIALEAVAHPPIISIGRGFSAPIIVDDGLDRVGRELQMQFDPDAFTRWEAGQKLMRSAMLDGGKEQITAFARIADALKTEMARANDDPAFTALALRPPDLADLLQAAKTPDPDRLHQARCDLRATIYQSLASTIAERLSHPEPTPFAPSADQAGERALRTACMDLLAASGVQAGKALMNHFKQAQSMNESMAALEALGASGAVEFDEALAQFYQRWQSNALVLDKWFAVQAAHPRADSQSRLLALKAHPDFTLKTPNRARAVLMGFANRNLTLFHAQDGWGYRFLADAICETDSFNPALASRLLTPFESWRRFDAQRQAHAKAALDSILRQPNLSANAREMVVRTSA